MQQHLIVTDKITIAALPARVWEVLTNPAYMRQWEEMPENFGDEPLQLGSVITYEGFSTLTVTTFEVNRLLVLSVYLPNVALAPTDYNIAYRFTLRPENGHTVLDFEIGDFAPVPNAQQYYDMSVQFAETSLQKIKTLAELA
ncbi:SRPBCC domain-containing protein [Pontibacter sp. Tf4]|uniref:SRPBCC family protein n=1 Tax=Pontibacter sp. Tf4 TaxID=2761620 RepID=UPI001623C1D3|nr:SRPBCC domain-containing protein [Pontibacter sp. Tf4]MBB6611697.1 SRPBCC domain-containing protein [Pontibacter sp. Tf4]